MSREILSYVSLFLCWAIILNAKCASSVPDRCLELVRFDVDEIENHLSELNLTDVPTVKMMTAGFKCPISALPFGALKSDWARLLLLQEAQPDGSIIKLKLVRLMRILIIAYYQMEERIDVVTEPEPRIAKTSLVGETTTTVPAVTRQSQCPCNNSLAVSSNNGKHHRSCIFSNVTRLATKNDCSNLESNATLIETVTMKNLSNPNGITTAAPFDVTRQNVMSSIDLGTTTTYHPGNAKKAALRILDNCLKQSLRDVALRRSSSKVFEIVKNKVKSIENNEIDNHEKDRTVRISPRINEFWRYVTFPTRTPLNITSVAPAYRMRGLNGFKTGLRKSRKRVKLNNDIYESFRRFYGIDKNAKGV